MSDDVITKTITGLRSTVFSLSEQMAGNKDARPFLSTLFDSFGVGSMDDLLEKFFKTDEYNDEWLKIVGKKDGSEKYEGVRCRFAIVFLCMLKKALMRVDDRATDVERLWGEDFGCTNSAYDSLAHMRIKMGKASDESNG